MGLFKMPIGFDMGTAGAAIATVIGQIVAFILAAIINHRKNADVRLELKKFRPQKQLIARIYAIGLPSVIMMAIGSVMTWLMNIILINYTSGKETAATVFGAYFKLNSFVFMPVFGLNNGVIPILAYNYGAQKRSRMTKTIRVSLVLRQRLHAAGHRHLPRPCRRCCWAFSTPARRCWPSASPALRIIGSTFVVAGVCIVLSFGVPGAGVQPLLHARLPGAPADRAGAGGVGAGRASASATRQRRPRLALLPGGGGRLGGGDGVVLRAGSTKTSSSTIPDNP